MSDLTSPGFTFLICKMGNNYISFRTIWSIELINTYKTLEQNLALAINTSYY